MLPYWVLFSVFATGSFLYQPRPREQRTFAPFFWFAGLCVALMIGLRYRVGVDWVNYVRIYNELRWEGFDDVLIRGDPLFYVTMWLFRQSGVEIWAFLLLCGVVFTAGLFAFANRQANPWLAVLIAIPFLIIAMAMSGVRQSTAIGFFFFALVALADRSPARFLGWVLCAGACHGSAILMVPLAGLSFTRNRLQSALLLSVMAVAAYFTLRTPFENYAQDYLQGNIESAGAFYRLVMNGIPGLIFLMFMKRFPIAPHERSFWRNMSIFTVLSFPLLQVVSSTALDRLALYAFPLQLFVLSYVPYLITKLSSGRFLLTLGIVLYLATIQFVFLNYAINKDPYVPYRFWPLAEKRFDLSSAAPSSIGSARFAVTPVERRSVGEPS
jgi:hypothetical protein